MEVKVVFLGRLGLLLTLSLWECGSVMAASYVGTPGDVDKANDKCIRLIVAAKQNQAINPSDPAIQECSHQAGRDVCGKAQQYIESSSINNSASNHGQKKLASCKGVQVAEAKPVTVVSFDPNTGNTIAIANGVPNNPNAIDAAHAFMGGKGIEVRVISGW